MIDWRQNLRVRRIGVALIVAVVAAGCGGDADERTGSPEEAAVVPTVRTPPQEQGALRLARVEAPPYALTLYAEAVGGPDCLSAELEGDEDLVPYSRVQGQSCIGGRPWHVRVGMGGDPGSVSWALVVAGTRGQVADVIVTTASGARRQLATYRVPDSEWRTGGLRLDEAVTAVEARASDGRVIEALEIPAQVVGPCDWTCAGQGPWAAELDAHSASELPPEPPDPEQAILAADDRLRALFDGTRFTLYPGLHWRRCADVSNGRVWVFMPSKEESVDLERWPTLDRDGGRIEIEGRGPPELVVVDLDLARGRVVSILPYYSSDRLPWVGSEHPEAPLASDACRDAT